MDEVLAARRAQRAAVIATQGGRALDELLVVFRCEGCGALATDDLPRRTHPSPLPDLATIAAVAWDEAVAVEARRCAACGGPSPPVQVDRHVALAERGRDLVARWRAGATEVELRWRIAGANGGAGDEVEARPTQHELRAIGRDAWLRALDARLELGDRAGFVAGARGALAAHAGDERLLALLPALADLGREHGDGRAVAGDVASAHAAARPGDDAAAALALRWRGELALRAARAGEPGDVASAERDLERAQALAPGDRSVSLLHAEALRRLGRGDEAARDLERLARERPDDVEVGATLGLLLLDLDRAEDALARLSRADALARERDGGVALARARALLRLGRAGEAGPHVERARRLVPDDPRLGPLELSLERALGRAAPAVDDGPLFEVLGAGPDGEPVHERLPAGLAPDATLDEVDDAARSALRQVGVGAGQLLLRSPGGAPLQLFQARTETGRVLLVPFDPGPDGLAEVAADLDALWAER